MPRNPQRLAPSLRASPHRRTPLKSTILTSSSSPSSSSSSPWKDAFKQKCLQRARQKRQERLHSKRIRLPPPSCSVQDDQEMSNKTTFMSSSLEAQELIQEELQRHYTPSSQHAPLHSFFQTPPVQRQPSMHIFHNQETISNVTMGEYRDSENGDHHHIFNEEELFQLMQEVEDELQREEAFIEEEMNHVEMQYLHEQALLEEQMADFKIWQQQQQQQQQHCQHP